MYFLTLQNTPRSKYNDVKKYIKNFDIETGQFKDLDYNDNSAAVWQPGMHWRRMVDMARIYQLPGSDLYHDTHLKDCIIRAIKYWLSNNHMAKNAWWNLIGVPYDMGKVFILMEKEIPTE